jgi:hypothetical protein
MFVILDRAGEPLRSFEGDLILLPTQAEAASWLLPGERVEEAANQRASATAEGRTKDR